MQISFTLVTALFDLNKIENIFVQPYSILNKCFKIRDLWKYGITFKIC